MYRRAFVIAAGLCAAAIMTIGTVASASGDAGKKVNFVVASPIPPTDFGSAFLTDPSRCSSLPCVVPITPIEPSPDLYNDQITGDFVGSGTFVKGAVLGTFIDPNLATLDIPYTSYEPYSITIQGCGTGTVIVRRTGNVGVVAGSTTGDWQFVPNSGRDGLAGISGSGTFTVSHNNPGGTESQISVGKVRCK
jgi:hypothetical protein